jgi:hypothetical protein
MGMLHPKLHYSNLRLRKPQIAPVAAPRPRLPRYVVSSPHPGVEIFAFPRF